MKQVTERNELAGVVAGEKSVVLYHATWCPFCRSFRPTFEKLTAGAGLQVVEAVLDDEENPIWIDQKIEVVPTVVFYENGRPSRRLDGRAGVGLTEDDLRQALRATPGR